jgi:hypothetical protein
MASLSAARREYDHHSLLSMNSWRLFFCCCVLVLGLGCRRAEDTGESSQKKPLPTPTEAELFATVQENIKALENKDADGVMATLHPAAPGFATSRNMLAEMFSSVDLKFTLSDLRVISASPQEARVGFVQKTEKVGGNSEFKDNTIEGFHVLRPDQGKWKIYTTVQTKGTKAE